MSAKSRLSKWLLCCVCGLGVVACATVFEGNARDAKVPVILPDYAQGHSLADLEKGRRLYAQGCVSCHGLFDISAYTAEQWSQELDEMLPMAGHKGKKAVLVRAYIQAAVAQSDGLR